MSMQLGYYTSHTPGDESFLKKVQEQYGSTFEKMTKREKLSILMILASNISAQLDGGVRGEIYDVARAMCDQLPLSDQAGIMESIVSQIIRGQSAKPVHHS